MAPSAPSAPDGIAQILSALDDATTADDVAARVCALCRSALAADAAAVYLARADAAPERRGADGLAADPPADGPGALDAAGHDRLSRWAAAAGHAHAELIPLAGAHRREPLGLLALFGAAPLAAADRDRLAAGVADALVRAGAGTPRVLLVEDDPDNREAMSSLLSLSGFDVTAVDSGGAALRAFAPGRFAVILTDLSLPDVDGWQIAVEIKRAAPTTPIALITGWGVPLEEPELRRRGVDLVIKKPLDPRNLLAELENLLQVGGRSPSA
jgi:CheY-like chemotaxis protein